MGNPWFQFGDHGLRPELIAKMKYVTFRHVLRLSVSLASHSWPHRQSYLALLPAEFHSLNTIRHKQAVTSFGS